MGTTRFIGAACGLGLAVSASGQCDTRWTQDGPSTDDASYGILTTNLGDLDGDGSDDIIAQFYSSTGGDMGWRFTSSEDGQVLSECNFCGPDVFYPTPMGDLDNDGIAEWLRVGAFGVGLRSGMDTRIWWVSTEIYPGGLNSGDLDGDGVTDFGVGDAGATTFYSGATQVVIATIAFKANNGLAVADLSGDGVGDLVLHGYSPEVTQVRSGADLSLLYTLPDGRYGSSMVEVGDRDGDGATDLVLAARDEFSGFNGGVVLYSGANGHPMASIAGTASEPIAAVYSAGDWNLDGVPDVVVSAPEADYNGYRAGRVSICSGDDLRVIERFDGQAAPRLLGGTSALVENLPGQIRPAIVLTQPAYQSYRGRISLVMSRCRADFNCDDTVNTLDVLAFLGAFAAGDLTADANFDNEVNSLDVLEFLNIWARGC